MAGKDTKKRALMWTILLIALVQMPQRAITPAINLISTKIFPEVSFSTIQTIMTIPNLVAVFGGILSALVVRLGLLSKKALVVIGLSLITLSGAAAVTVHTQLWHLVFYNAIIGLGVGALVPNIQSIMIDSYDEKMRQFITGIQLAFINFGGLYMSILGGFLTRAVWYGGYMLILTTLPIVVIAIIFIPKTAGRVDPGKKQKAPLPGEVYYITFLVLVFMIFFNVGAINLSTHLANARIGDSGTAGIGIAMMMAGGVVCALLFTQLSTMFRNHLFTLSFALLFVGYALLGFITPTVPTSMIAMFLVGASMSLILPRGLFVISNFTVPENSATATMLVANFAPGVGSFLSPVIVTNLTIALGNEDTGFRYGFTGVVCLVFAILVFFNTRRRDRKSALKEQAGRS